MLVAVFHNSILVRINLLTVQYQYAKYQGERYRNEKRGAEIKKLKKLSKINKEKRKKILKRNRKRD